MTQDATDTPDGAVRLGQGEPRPSERSDFREKLLLSIIDKLVFGLLIVFAGFVLNLVLEKHRSNEAVKNEIARLRVERVAQVWTALDAQQREIEAYGVTSIRDMRAYLDRTRDDITVHRSVRDRVVPRSAPSRGGPVSEPQRARNTQWDRMRTRQARAVQLLQANRFWIGGNLYPQYVAYAALERDLLSAYQEVTQKTSRVVARELSKCDVLSPGAGCLPRLKAAEDSLVASRRDVEARKRELAANVQTFLL
jgi:hypothetical protein